jgi:aspartyl-tRNA(Asn)/glutamyl-tRNA(Gln) amidotransferase subunit A
VADARLALRVLADVRLPPPAPLTGLRLGVVPGTEALPLTAAVERSLLEATTRAEPWAGPARPVPLPMADELQDIYATVQGAEALPWHRAAGHWPAHAELIGDDVRGRLQRSEAITPERAEAAARRRDVFRQHVAALFENVDLLLMPVAATGPSRTDNPDVVDFDGRSADLRAAVLPWALLASLCGLPACSVPAGFDEDGLPIGLQVVGPAGSDGRVLDAAAALAVPLT